MSTVAETKMLVINEFMGGSRSRDKKVEFSHCVVRDPREKMDSDWFGFEVITSRDGGKRVTWSRYNLEQIREAKEKFEQLIASGLVPYYIDPDTGLAAEIVMDKFDPAAQAVMFEEIMYDHKNVMVAPTQLATGG